MLLHAGLWNACQWFTLLQDFCLYYKVFFGTFVITLVGMDSRDCIDCLGGKSGNIVSRDCRDLWGLRGYFNVNILYSVWLPWIITWHFGVAILTHEWSYITSPSRHPLTQQHPALPATPNNTPCSIHHSSQPWRSSLHKIIPRRAPLYKTIVHQHQLQQQPQHRKAYLTSLEHHWQHSRHIHHPSWF